LGVDRGHGAISVKLGVSYPDGNQKHSNLDYVERVAQVPRPVIVVVDVHAISRDY